MVDVNSSPEESTSTLSPSWRIVALLVLSAAALLMLFNRRALADGSHQNGVQNPAASISLSATNNSNAKDE